MTMACCRLASASRCCAVLLPLLLLAAAHQAAAAKADPAAAMVTVSQCVWRESGGGVCDAAPAMLLSRLPANLDLSGGASGELANATILAAAMEAACHAIGDAKACRAAGGCAWDGARAPACGVESALLLRRDALRSGCPGSLLEAYQRCGAAISAADCAEAGDDCAWSGGAEAADGGRSGRAGSTPARSLLQRGAAGGSAVPRACAPRQVHALEAAGDAAGAARLMRSIASRDAAAWGDCPAGDAARAIAKRCAKASSAGTCRAVAPPALCAWNEALAACAPAGGGHVLWALEAHAAAAASANATSTADDDNAPLAAATDDAAACARAASAKACAAVGDLPVDARLFARIQMGRHFGAAAAAAKSGAAPSAASALLRALAAAVAAAMLLAPAL